MRVGVVYSYPDLYPACLLFIFMNKVIYICVVFFLFRFLTRPTLLFIIIY